MRPSSKLAAPVSAHKTPTPTPVNSGKLPTSTTIPVDGGVAFYSSTSPRNVFVAFKGIDVLVEVFAPDAAAAQAALRLGQVQLVR